MTFIMVMVDTSIPTAISILAIGLMGSGQAGVNLSTNLAKFMKACGSIASLLEAESPRYGIKSESMTIT